MEHFNSILFHKSAPANHDHHPIIIIIIINNIIMTVSIVLEWWARLEIQSSWVQTRLRSMDVLGRKNSEHKSSSRDFNP